MIYSPKAVYRFVFCIYPQKISGLQVWRVECAGIAGQREFRTVCSEFGKQDGSEDEVAKGTEVQKNIPLTEALFYILLAVRKPNHGYGIIQEVEKLTEGRLVLGPGTLYGAVQAMSAKGWIRIYSAETDSRKKKEYIITDLGKAIFAEEKKRLAELLRNAEKMEGEGDGEISTVV